MARLLKMAGRDISDVPEAPLPGGSLYGDPVLWYSVAAPRLRTAAALLGREDVDSCDAGRIVEAFKGMISLGNINLLDPMCFGMVLILTLKAASFISKASGEHLHAAALCLGYFVAWVLVVLTAVYLPFPKKNGPEYGDDDPKGAGNLYWGCCGPTAKEQAADLCHRTDAQLLRMVCGRTCN